jgi:hypothetical protein
LPFLPYNLLPRGLQAAAVAAVDASGTAYVVQKMWECCGTIMHEWVTNYSYDYDGSYVDYMNFQDTAYYHTERDNPCPGGHQPPGWYLGGHSDSWTDTAGGTYTRLRGEGYVNFPYQGAFDCGQFYYNQMWNALTVYGNGATPLCSWQWNIQNGWDSWRDQYYCEPGNTANP